MYFHMYFHITDGRQKPPQYPMNVIHRQHPLRPPFAFFGSMIKKE